MEYRKLALACKAAAYQIMKIDKEIDKAAATVMAQGVVIDLENIIATLLASHEKK
jgi:hypothetical protein